MILSLQGPESGSSVQRTVNHSTGAGGVRLELKGVLFLQRVQIEKNYKLIGTNQQEKA